MGRKYKSYTYEEYERAMELLKKGYGLTETCRILGWPKTKNSLLYYWKRGKHKPPLARWKAEPCIELGYATGTIQGDGNVNMIRKRYRYRIILDTIDPEFAETFSRAMSRLLGVKYHKPWWDEKQKVWWVVYRSKAFYTWYKRTEKQGLEGFKEYIEYSKETVRYYLKGLYDSEGNNDRNKQIHLSNSNKELLKYVQYLLNKYFNIIATGPYLQKKGGSAMTINRVKTTTKHNCYAIVISRKEHIQKFLEEIGFSIVRKQLGLKKDEKPYVDGIGYVEPYELVKLGLFKLPF